jgi:hypothetical protein
VKRPTGCSECSCPRASCGSSEPTSFRGRGFTDAETEVETKAPVAIISHEAWETRFGSDPALIGKTVVLNGQPQTVIGIAKTANSNPVRYTRRLPTHRLLPERQWLERGNRGVAALGTLKAGVTFANAERDLKALAKRQEETFPTTTQGVRCRASVAEDQIVGPTKTPLYIVFAAVGMVLLIACATSRTCSSPAERRATRALRARGASAPVERGSHSNSSPKV